MQSWRIVPADLCVGGAEMHVFLARVRASDAAGQLHSLALGLVLSRVHRLPHADGALGLPGGDADLRISSSHYGGTVAVALCRGAPTGVSLQGVPDRPADDTHYPLTPREKRLLARRTGEERAEAVARLWTRKDAALRVSGAGVWGGPQRVEAIFDSASAVVVPDADGLSCRYVHVYDLPRLGRLVGAVASASTPVGVYPWLVNMPSAAGGAGRCPDWADQVAGTAPVAPA